MLGPIVIWTALGLIAAGVIVSWRALWHVAPGYSRVGVLLRGNFQRRQHFTPAGWQWLTRGRLLMAAGFALLLVGVFGLGGM